MSRILRFLVVSLILLAGVLPVRHAQSAQAVERGAAITDPLALRELDRGWFGLNRVMLPTRSSDVPLTNSQLFALPSIAPVRKALDDEFERYVSRHKPNLPNETIGVGDSFALQLFDRTLLFSDDSRFVLAGIVNRMDRAFVAPDSCGEIRLIYRLTRTDVSEATGEGAASPRLPMTLNVVLKAKGEVVIDGGRGNLARQVVGSRQDQHGGGMQVDHVGLEALEHFSGGLPGDAAVDVIAVGEIFVEAPEIGDRVAEEDHARLG